LRFLQASASRNSASSDNERRQPRAAFGDAIDDPRRPRVRDALDDHVLATGMRYCAIHASACATPSRKARSTSRSAHRQAGGTRRAKHKMTPMPAEGTLENGFATATSAVDAAGPWNPGIVSPVPRELRPLMTLFRPEHASTTYGDAEELHDLTGLPLADIAALRPQRLALHELLVRVTADVSVPDGPRIEDLGINFRAITTAIVERYLAPRMSDIVAAYAALRADVAARVGRELDALLAAPTPTAPPRSTRLAFFGRRRTEPPSVEDAASRERRVIERWETRLSEAQHPVERVVLRALLRVASALIVRHGRAWGDARVLARLVTDLACNEAGPDAIGALVAPLVREAAAREGYALLHAQERPVVMNTKGPSAAGKSTIRPLQRTLAGNIGVRWSDFALISPDIWRKQLLDYGSLGPHFRYGGAFTGDELAIIDQKLDRYMAAKAARDDMPHLLIDRFRFDSFAPDSEEAGSNLLTRFGQVVYLFLLITPPAQLVERAWNRGLQVGRYKAVDDTLAHGVEAYAGMPELYFIWARRHDKRVHVEFLDNNVPQGERPLTVAFGWNDALNLLDVGTLIDVERYRRVNVNATRPQDLFPDASALRAEHNSAFLRQCIERIPLVNFAVRETGRIWLRVESGHAAWRDADAFAHAVADADVAQALRTALPDAFAPDVPATGGPRHIVMGEKIHTVGRWGPSDLPP